MPKIILGVSSSFCAHFLRGQVDYLVKNGYEVIIISGPGQEIEELARNEKARLIIIPFTKKISPVKDGYQLLKIISIIKKEKPDLVNAGNPKSGLLIMLACYFSGLKNRVFTLHGLVSDSKTGLLKRLMTITEKISCNIAKKVIVVSGSLKIHAEQRNILPANKGWVIEKGSANGIDLQKFSRTPSVIENALSLKSKYGLHERNIVLCYVGRLTKDKGIDVLFEAFNRLAKKYTDLRLLIAGPLIPENAFSPRFMRQLHNDAAVIFMGEISDIIPVYATADILVLPSFREGLPNVLIEAAAMETPVIASDIPGCRDAVQTGFNGELFEKGNINNLTALIERMINDATLRKEYGKNGRAFAEANFDRKKIWDGQLAVYKTLQNSY